MKNIFDICINKGSICINKNENMVTLEGLAHWSTARLAFAKVLGSILKSTSLSLLRCLTCLLGLQDIQ